MAQLYRPTYLGIQLGEVLSLSHVANKFIGTETCPLTASDLDMLDAFFKKICDVIFYTTLPGLNYSVENNVVIDI